MTNRLCILRGIVPLLVASVLSGCGGCGSNGARQEDGRRNAAATDGCGGVSLDAAAEILDIDREDLVSEETPDEDFCRFSSRTEPAKALMFSLTLMDSDAEARELLEAMAEALGAISPIEPRPDIGDGGFLASSAKARRLLFRSGTSVFDLMQPSDPKLQQRAARRIASAL